MMFFRTEQQFLRRADGRWHNGRWEEGAEEELTVLATVQPASLSDYDTLQAEVGARRLERVVRIYTAEVLLVAGAQNDSNGDILVWQGNRYEVIAVSPWRTLLPHYRYWASLELAPDQPVEEQ
jgi:hypothetical protein